MLIFFIYFNYLFDLSYCPCQDIYFVTCTENYQWELYYLNWTHAKSLISNINIMLVICCYFAVLLSHAMGSIRWRCIVIVDRFQLVVYFLSHSKVLKLIWCLDTIKIEILKRYLKFVEYSVAYDKNRPKGKPTFALWRGKNSAIHNLNATGVVWKLYGAVVKIAVPYIYVYVIHCCGIRDNGEIS